ncbi:NAD(P)-dependent oxidoreductase [Methylobacterium crusticola]|uniref:NAD(P)-dependent oxidoreductase n=1 Tax=Methylobacterium crusticola TaxID=1697972 RepID=UPI001EE39180|nr:NAD(P)-dependent oxidoreductase [Methylobacterium crusticola]
MTDRPTLGFIGIGLMGEAMTRRLLDRGWTVTVWNREPGRLDTVVPYGARAAASPARVAEASDVVLVCVLDTDAVQACVFGPDGVAQARPAPALLVDFSTIDPEATRRFAQALGGTGWIDAPISGGPDAARDGRMTVMAGGSETDLARVRPVLADLAGNVTRMGGVGAGQTTKMINQAIVGAGFVVMAEALALAERAGIDAAALPACLEGGFADSSLLRRLYPQMQARAFDPPKSYARQLLKDLRSLGAFAQGLGLDLPMAGAAQAQYRAHVEAGSGLRDSASIIDLYQARDPQARDPGPAG